MLFKEKMPDLQLACSMLQTIEHFLICAVGMLIFYCVIQSLVNAINMCTACERLPEEALNQPACLFSWNFHVSLAILN